MFELKPAEREVIGKRNCDICGQEYEPVTHTYKSGYVTEYPWANLIRIDHTPDLKRSKTIYKWRTCPECSKKVLDFIATMFEERQE
jgi:hypothetical protein